MTKNFSENVNVINFIVNAEANGNALVSSKSAETKRDAKSGFLFLLLMVGFIFVTVWAISNNVSKALFVQTELSYLGVYVVGILILLKQHDYAIPYRTLQNKLENILPATIFNDQHAYDMIMMLALAGKKDEAVNTFMNDQKLLSLIKSFDDDDSSSSIRSAIDADCEKLYQEYGMQLVATAIKRVNEGDNDNLKTDLLRNQNKDKVDFANSSASLVQK